MRGVQREGLAFNNLKSVMNLITVDKRIIGIRRQTYKFTDTQTDK